MKDVFTVWWEQLLILSLNNVSVLKDNTWTHIKFVNLSKRCVELEHSFKGQTVLLVLQVVLNAVVQILAHYAKTEASILQAQYVWPDAVMESELETKLVMMAIWKIKTAVHLLAQFSKPFPSLLNLQHLHKIVDLVWLASQLTITIMYTQFSEQAFQLMD